jgi:DNA-binding NarL/FixJ family response regulator
LEQQTKLEVVGEVMDAGELLTRAKTDCPDLVLLDWSLQQMLAGGLVSALRKVCPDVSVVVLSEKPEARSAALTAGADAFVTKMDPPEELLAAIWSVQQIARIH